jgi:hypothetical protein
MKLILEIDIDDATGAEYEHLAPENKLRFKQSVENLLMKITTGQRAKKLRKLLKEMRQESGAPELDPETLYAIVRGQEY